VVGECTIPPPPVKHILNSYVLSNPTSRRAIADYVESQARGETVQHAEKIKSEHLLGRDYDCWDVHTQRDRLRSNSSIRYTFRVATSRDCLPLSQPIFRIRFLVQAWYK
jgi:hypothetical protein